MEKSVMDTICSSFDNFFDSEKKIAKYIINHYDKVVDMTVGQLAKASGASEASVSRFCKKIGVKGFHHLKISLAKEMVESDINEVSVSNNISFDDISQSLQNILANKVEELKQTVSLMDNDQLPVILKEILNARSVQLLRVMSLSLSLLPSANIRPEERQYRTTFLILILVFMILSGVIVPLIVMGLRSSCSLSCL